MSNTESLSESNGKLRQFLVAVIVNLVALSSGITWGWPSPVIPQLRSKTPPVGDTPMTEDQISWLSSLMAIGGLLMIPFCGILSERLGRKKVAHLTGLPHIISWLLIIFGQNHICLFLARIAGGMGAAMTLFIVPIYVSEIASDEIRGLLGSLLLFGINMGILFAYVVGAYTPYRLFACLSVLFSMSFVAIFWFMPETPIYLVRQNRPLEAHKSLMFLRGNNRALVDQELAKLRSQINTSDTTSNTVRLTDFINDQATRKGLIISFLLLGGQQLSGILAMISYAETIFKRAGSSLPSAVASIIIALIQIVGSYMSTMLMERAGRRMLTLISCLGMSISHFLVSLFFYLQLNDHNVTSISWLPLVALSAYVIFYCLGIGPVPFVVTSEVFRPHISSSATTICFIFYWTISFAAIQTFDVATRILGIDGCFFMLACFCAACLVLSFWLVPETKGRERQDIVDELAGIGGRGGVRSKPV